MKCVRILPSRHQAGVTLVEALVVLAILGLVTAVVAVPINSYWQRSRIQSTAGDIRNFIQTAYTRAVSQHTAITVTLVQDSTTRKWTLQLTPDPAGAPAGWHAMYGTYVIPDFVDLTYNLAASAGGWPTAGASPPPVSGATSSLICDTMSRTLCPVGFASCDPTSTTPAQVTSVRTLSITHTSMIDGSLTPKTRYDIQIYPIWNVSYQKVLL
ncbi:MAG: prepilin-type N-terminal cleavage/methylation domain-containing protein [Acidobacteriia bacterium]|nr:prepilin-type N-terminal cleavage/methylation domain-containing protein [Terriglobia bacterium]